MNPSTTKKDLFYPPGGFLLWLVLSVELLTIFLGIIFFTIDRKNNLAIFQQSILHNNFYIGLLNTFVLLGSGFFIAQAVHQYDKKSQKDIAKSLFLSLALGLTFIAIKLYEYKLKIASGYTFQADLFFTYYWLFTLFHLFHVVIGISLLTYAIYKTRTSEKLEFSVLDPIGLFWHLCDLIWIIIFPLFYQPVPFLSGMHFPILFFLIKAIIVLYFFMNVRQAHALWKIYAAAIILVFGVTTLLN